MFSHLGIHQNGIYWIESLAINRVDCSEFGQFNTKSIKIGTPIEKLLTMCWQLSSNFQRFFCCCCVVRMCDTQSQNYSRQFITLAEIGRVFVVVVFSRLFVVVIRVFSVNGFQIYVHIFCVCLVCCCCCCWWCYSQKTIGRIMIIINTNMRKSIEIFLASRNGAYQAKSIFSTNETEKRGKSKSRRRRGEWGGCRWGKKRHRLSSSSFSFVQFRLTLCVLPIL